MPEPAEEDDDLAAVEGPVYRGVVAHARAAIDDCAAPVGCEAQRHDLVRAPAEGGDVVRRTVGPDEQELGHVGEAPGEGDRLNRGRGEFDPPQVGAARDQERGPAGQQRERTPGERYLRSRGIRKAGDHTEGTPAWLGRDDLPVCGVEDVRPPAAIGDDVGEAAAGPGAADHRPAHRQGGHIDHLDGVRGERPQSPSPSLIGELDDRMRRLLRSDRGH